MTLSNPGLSEIDTPPSAWQAEPSRALRRVFYLVDSLNVGGTETQAVELALRIPALGYEVTLGCLRAQGPLLSRLNGSGVVVREFHPTGGVDSPAGVYQLLRLSWFLRQEKFHIVHTHDLWSNLMGIPAARLAEVPAIVSSRRDLAHFEWYRGKRRTWLRRIQNLSGAVLANASPIRDSLITEDGFPPAKVRVIHNGVDPERFRRGREARERLFPDVGDAKLIVLVGNMHSDVKGHPWLIASAPGVIREFPNVRFVMVGDGEQRPRFEQQVADLSLGGHFLFLGSRGDVAEILACCDIAVLPSRAEGLSNAVLEYMAAGLPTIVSRVGGNPELIADGVRGLVVPPEDSAALSGALLKLLRDPALMRRLAQSGREYIEQNYSYERLVRQVDGLYSDLLREKGGER
ncbi:MAG TPA: glycosyltransferase [Candidatus Sulfotelmatobacter sp.]|nr:glycosyltransferase [Candidatus Sulfotelmatobacter sp.]